MIGYILAAIAGVVAAMLVAIALAPPTSEAERRFYRGEVD